MINAKIYKNFKASYTLELLVTRRSARIENFKIWYGIDLSFKIYFKFPIKKSMNLFCFCFLLT